MRKEFKDKFIVYSHSLDSFIPIRKLGDEELETLVEEMINRVTTPKYSITKYVDFMLSKLVINYNDVLAECGDDGAIEALFECVTEIYQGFSLELINKTINSYIEASVQPSTKKRRKVLTYN